MYSNGSNFSLSQFFLLTPSMYTKESNFRTCLVHCNRPCNVIAIQLFDYVFITRNSHSLVIVIS
jgi:hypothetical protein